MCPAVPAMHFLGKFELDDVCVTYPTHGNSVASLVSKRGLCAGIFGYLELRKNYAMLSRVRPPEDGEDLGRCTQRRIGLGIRFSSNNIYHQNFYAAAAYNALIDSADAHATFVPIGAGNPATVPSAQWEYTLRGLSNKSAAALADETQGLLRARCTCFERLLVATHALQPFSTSARPSMVAFRRAMAVHARLALVLPPRSSSHRDAQDMLFVLRRGSRRVMTNAKEVEDLLRPALPRLRMVAFEDMPLMQQIVTVAESSAIIGVHGQALTGYVVHLAAEERKTAVVEIRPRPDPRSWDWTLMVSGLARAAGVRFLSLTAPHAPGCIIDELRRNDCATDECNRAHAALVRVRLRSFGSASVLNCNITVDAQRLLALIRQAAAHTAS